MSVLVEGYLVDGEQAVLEYGDMVYRLAMARMDQPADAQDVFGEVFLRLVKHRHKIKSPDHLKAWLLKVTVNCCNSHHTASWKQNVRFLGEGEELPQSDSPFPSDNGLLQALHQCPPGTREALHLFYFEGYSLKETAHILSRPEGTIKSLLSRGRTMLKEYLEP